MSRTSVPIHSPAPAPAGPVACTLHPDELPGRLDDFRRHLFAHLRAMERPQPTRLRLVLSGHANSEAVRDLLAREQACCAFLGFALTAEGGRLVVDLWAPAEAAPVLDALAGLTEPAAPGR
jgi:hypothetical protein